MQALEMGAVETLIVWEHLATMRYEFAAASSSPSRATTVLYLQPEEVKEKGHPVDSETGNVCAISFPQSNQLVPCECSH